MLNYVCFFFGVSLDIDECIGETDPCDTNAVCLDTEGSFTCTCDVGYSGTGLAGGGGCTGE